MWTKIGGFVLLLGLLGWVVDLIGDNRENEVKLEQWESEYKALHKKWDKEKQARVTKEQALEKAEKKANYMRGELEDAKQKARDEGDKCIDTPVNDAVSDSLQRFFAPAEDMHDVFDPEPPEHPGPGSGDSGG